MKSVKRERERGRESTYIFRTNFNQYLALESCALRVDASILWFIGLFNHVLNIKTQ
jgi:hypothetical protein